MRARVGLLGAAALVAWWWRYGPRVGLVTVSGGSMRPTLEPGDWCAVAYGVPIRPDDLVVARLPQRPLGVKRARVHDGTGWWVSSDDPLAGTDSATFGVVPDGDVLGRVVLRYWPRPALLRGSGRG